MFSKAIVGRVAGSAKELNLLAFFLFFLIVSASAEAAKTQGHPFSQIYYIDSNINMSGFNITNLSYFGIGTIAPAYPLDVAGTGRIANNLYVGGLIGIGTSSPKNALNVIGDMNATGSIYGVSIYQNGNAVLDNASSLSTYNSSYDAAMRANYSAKTDYVNNQTERNLFLSTYNSSYIQLGGDLGGIVTAPAVRNTQGLAWGNLTSWNLNNAWAGSLGWGNLTGYPNNCVAGEAIQSLGSGIFTCIALNSTSGNISGAGNPNYVAKFNGTNIIGSSSIYDNGTNVGIGTYSPLNPLNVIGDINATGNIYGMNALCIGTDCKASWSLVAGTASPWDNSSTQTYIRAEYPSYINVSNTLFVNGSSSNVGIGTETPNARLEVAGGMRLNTASAKPMCNAVQRGTFWLEQSSEGADDYMYACMRNSTSGYNWVLVARAG